MSVKDEIKKMFVAFDVNPDTAKIKAAVFVEDLAEYNQDDVAEAIKKARKSCKFCPRVADIIEFLEPSEHELEAAMNSEIAQAVSFLKGRFRQGLWECPFDGEDGAVYHAFNVVMERDWSEESSMKYFYRAFEDAYKSHAKLPSYRQNLIALEAEEKRKRLESYEKNGGLLNE